MAFGGTRERYFAPCHYNAVRVVNALAALVREAGGTVSEPGDELHIHLRGDYNAKKEEAPVVNTKFVTLVADLWIRFELDGYSYLMEFDDNPFFPDTVGKYPVNVDGMYYLDEIQAENKFYYPDSFFPSAAEESLVVEAAEKLLRYLRGRRQSEGRYDKRRNA